MSDNEKPVLTNIFDIRMFIPVDTQVMSLHARRVKDGYETVVVLDGSPQPGPFVSLTPGSYDTPKIPTHAAPTSVN